MRTRIGSSQIALFAAFITLMAGCQQDPGALVPVSGRVKFQGVPLSGGWIVFTPDVSKGENGEIAHGEILKDGTYTLFTGDAAGAHAGYYKVTVSQPGQTGSDILPDKYRHPELSKISCKITLSQANPLDIDLTADKPDKK